MGEMQRPDMGGQVSEMTRTPAGLVTIAAAIVLALYVIFEVLLAESSVYWVPVVSAALVLVGQFRPTGSASVLRSASTVFVLALVIFIWAVLDLIYSVRWDSLPSNATDWIAYGGSWVAG
ncbi:MAG TPA: hypothetical protein VK831_07135, partial [Candidatus Deferrimicrobiaceae bacterium]|nr:hypothetical protein [Candidatus Deferrimicrobiaceae bacterium]